MDVEKGFVVGLRMLEEKKKNLLGFDYWNGRINVFWKLKMV